MKTDANGSAVGYLHDRLPDEWEWVLDATSMRKIVRASTNETFNRRVRQGWFLDPIAFPSPSPVFTDSVTELAKGGNGMLRYWRLSDGLVNLSIEELRSVSYKNVAVARDYSIAAVRRGFDHGWTSDVLFWEPLRARPRQERRTPEDFAQLALVVDGRLLDVHSDAPVSMLPGMSHYEVGLPARFRSDFVTWSSLVRAVAVERNLAAIRRDPRLLRANYSGWLSYAEHRPDRRHN